MTAEQAVYNFFSDFGLTTARAGEVFSGDIRLRLPYVLLPDFSAYSSGEKKEAAVEIYYRDGSDRDTVENKLKLLISKILYYGKTLSYTGGYINLTRGRQFYSPIINIKDSSLRGIRLNIAYEHSLCADKVSFSNASAQTVGLGIGCEVYKNIVRLGGKAVSVTGQSSIDYFGCKTELKILTDWQKLSEIEKLMGMIAASSVLNVSLSGGSAVEYIVDMPIIKQVNRSTAEGEYCKAEIHAAAKGRGIK